MTIILYVLYTLTIINGAADIGTNNAREITGILMVISIIMTFIAGTPLLEVGKKLSIILTIFLGFCAIGNYVNGTTYPGLIIGTFVSAIASIFFYLKLKYNRVKKKYQKKKIMTDCELSYYKAIREILPDGYILRPQVSLASIIEIKKGNIKDLLKFIDFGVFDQHGNIKVLIEINDITHNLPHRQRRDAQVKEICKEANIPLVTFWTKFRKSKSYIASRINQYL